MRPVRLRWLLAAGAALALLLAACSSPQTPTPAQPENPVVELDGYRAQIDTTKLDLQPLSFWNPPRTTYCENNVAYAQVVVPMLGLDGGQLTSYVDVFWMPRDWNHKLALYAHGYISPSDPGFLDQILNPGPSSAPLLETRDRLLCEGYALGASSFAGKGYAVQQGIVDTHLMNAVFPFIFWRRPSETYVFGSSMGGLITVALAELFPNRYDGAMPTCGPVAGSLAQFSYVGNVRLLFDTAFPTPPFPDVLPGDLTHWVPPDLDPVTGWIAQVAGLVTSAAGSAPFDALANTALTYELPYGNLTLPLLQTPDHYPLPFPPLPDDLLQAVKVNALLHALRYHVEGAQDVLDRGDGSPFSTLPFEDYGPLGTGAFVAPTSAYTADHSALLYYSLFYQPTGDLRIPMLTLHSWVDPDVPTVHEQLYRALVDARSPNPANLEAFLAVGSVPTDLVSLAAQLGVPASELPSVSPYGHCNMFPADLVEGMRELDQRVASGSWPAPSSPNFTPLPPLSVTP